MPTGSPGQRISVRVTTTSDTDLLHPFGRCRCAGEGRCAWCVNHAERERLIDELRQMHRRAQAAESQRDRLRRWAERLYSMLPRTWPNMARAFTPSRRAGGEALRLMVPPRTRTAFDEKMERDYGVNWRTSFRWSKTP